MLLAVRGLSTATTLSIALAIAACSSDGAPTGIPGSEAASEELGPLAVVAGFNGDKARNEGRLGVGAACVYLVQADGSRTFLVWPAGQVHWDRDARAITYANHDGAVNVFHHGDLIAVGGSGGNVVEGPPLQARRLQWVVPPSPGCDTNEFWLLGNASAI